MKKKRLIWQIFPTFLVIIIFALTATTWYAVDLVRTFYFIQTQDDLEMRAHLVRRLVYPDVMHKDYARINANIDSIGDEIDTRITVILPDGRVVADSEKDPENMENHGNRPEVIQALDKGIGTSTRQSTTIESELMYLAVPLRNGAGVVAVVRLSRPLHILESTLGSIQRKFAISGLVVLIITVIISLLVSRRINKPLEEMTIGIERFAQGDLSLQLPEPPSYELGKLAQALNQMGSQLDEKIKTIVQQKTEEHAILESMEEGVLAIDQEERIITVNKAAANMLRIKDEQIEGKDIHAIVKNSQLQNIILNTLQTGQYQEAEIVIMSKTDKNVQVHGTVLNDAEGRTIGAVIVLNDVTQLRRLENGRREFVANVSHEIRTPLTSIKGFVEALQEGAIKDHESANRFLEIIVRQTNRLNTIIEDLLTLSRLESEGERDEIILEESEIRPAIQNAVHICEPAAEKKHINLNIKCTEDSKVRMNAPLLEEALINLIDNAIKYSPENSEIDVKCKLKGKEMVLQVCDEGPGIAPEHIPRIFERFYRVDKARSRKVGGTGLGLAIVKHIALVHGGKVEVKSELGKGSRFKIFLPLQIPEGAPMQEDDPGSA